MINKKIKSLIALQRPARAEIRGTADINTKKLKQELHKSDSASRFKLIVDWGGGADCGANSDDSKKVVFFQFFSTYGTQ
jgi:hypothetical protein